MKKLNTYHYRTFAHNTLSRVILHLSLQKHAKCWVKYKHNIEKDSWPLFIREIEIMYNDKQNVLMLNDHTLPCYRKDGSCKPTNLTPYTITWLPQASFLIFSVQNFIGRTSKKTTALE